MEPEALFDEARQSISEFCIKECKAYCCRKGYLSLTEEEADLITKGRRKELEDQNKIALSQDGELILDLGGTNCPSLNKDFTCSIHKSKERPKACQDFPIFVTGKHMRLSPRCLAVRERKLYPYISQVIAMGFTLHTEKDPDIHE